MKTKYIAFSCNSVVSSPLYTAHNAKVYEITLAIVVAQHIFVIPIYYRSVSFFKHSFTFLNIRIRICTYFDYRVLCAF